MTGEQHRQLQLVLRAAVLRDLLRIWPMFDPADISGSWPVIEPAVVALIQARSTLSAGLASRYLRELGLDPTLAPMPGEDDIVQSLRVVGPANAGKLAFKGRTDEQIRATTFTNVAGDTGRQVLNAGRATVAATIATDRKVVGYRRVTDPNPCPFCSDQASRTHPPGAHFPAHSHCACFAEPVLR